jgi:hypothetical protein
MLRSIFISCLLLTPLVIGSRSGIAEELLIQPANEFSIAEPEFDASLTDNAEQNLPLTNDLSLNEVMALAAAPKPPVPKKKPTPPPPPPYKPVFYNNDFKQLAQPKFLGNELKRLEVGDCWTMDFGGEYRARYHNESNLRGTNFSNRSDSFLLHRTRLYANAEYSNLLRLYAEGIDAQSNYETFAPRTIEENRFDALNLFGDVLLLDDGDGKYKMRVGRQELIYGDQRLISPLDWANTRRTFDGAKIWYTSKDWDVDGFWVRQVPFSQHVNQDRNFDSQDDSQDFIGLYSTYKGKKDQTTDFYFLRFAEYEGPGTAFAPVDYDYNTFGVRWTGKDADYYGDGSFYWDTEGGYQFGNFGNQNQSSGYATVGIGRDWSKAQYKPKFMLYYDYASGDQNANDGVHGTNFQYFGLVHKYLGFADLIARQNIHDVNAQLTLATSKKSSLMLWHHIFFLDSKTDALYNVTGAPILIDPTGNSGAYVGQETDLTWQYNINPYSDFLIGYSHFWSGDFVKSLRPVGNDIDFTYLQYSIRF